MLNTWDALQRLAPTTLGQFSEYTEAERDELAAKVITAMCGEIERLRAMREQARIQMLAEALEAAYDRLRAVSPAYGPWIDGQCAALYIAADTAAHT
jgi:hypothetical protein